MEEGEYQQALKFLIEPPARFRNDETWGERRGGSLEEKKLNTLDLKRMNTVAIPALDFSRSVAILGDRGRVDTRGNGGGSGLGGFGGGLGIDLLVGAPILKGRRAGEGVLFSEGKSVRFKDEQEEHGRGMLEEVVEMGIDGKDGGETKFDPRFDVAVENGNGFALLECN